MKKPGRNDPCPCGSGKKYKKCCLQGKSDNVADFFWKKLRRIEQELLDRLLQCSKKHYEQQALFEAWGEFTLWDETPMDPEKNPEFGSIFIPWFLYHWLPDDSGMAETNDDPEIAVALTYLKKQGHGLSKLEKRFIQAACSQPYSFFVVTDVNPGQTMVLKDLFLDRQFLVYDESGTSSVVVGNLIFACVVTVDETSIILGCAPLQIPSAYYGHLIDVREYFIEEYGDIDIDFLLENDIELRDCYFDLKETILNPKLPEIRNTDGDPLQITKLNYELDCSPGEAFHALRTLAAGESEEHLLSSAEFDPQGELSAIRLPWIKKGNNTLMGTILIEGSTLIIDVNSENRSEEIKRKISRRLGKRAVFKHAVTESIQKMLEERDNKPLKDIESLDEDLQNSPEIQAMLTEMAKNHWEEWLDMPLPALKNKTPREAAKTEAGKERLEGLFMQFSQKEKNKQNAFTPDIDQLKQTLGM